MLEPGEEIEALRLARDRLADQLSRHAGERDSVAGKALQVIDIRRHSAEIRRAAYRDVDEAAPCIFDLRVGELGEDADHPLLRRGTRVARVEPRVADTAAEQQP